VGVVVGLVCYLILGQVFWLISWVIGGLYFGLLFGLDGLIKHFILRFFLARRGNLPWQLVPFLDEATRRLLLRKVGGSYIFVHWQLLRYFADLK
jgi:hypothetical protein